MHDEGSQPKHRVSINTTTSSPSLPSFLLGVLSLIHFRTSNPADGAKEISQPSVSLPDELVEVAVEDLGDLLDFVHEVGKFGGKDGLNAVA